MVSCVEEIHDAKRLINGVWEEVKAAGTEMPIELRIGAMIEIPSAALQADVLAREVDFFSIGTNDLVQYTLAVDRVNKLVGHLYQELHPSVLHLIRHVVEVCERTETPLTVCGEMAGNPLEAMLLAGMGIRSLSMSPSMIGPVKKALRSVEMSYLENMAKGLLQLTTAHAVREALSRQLGSYFGPVPHNAP
jgi:phosphotransferase system enzyme I (PtsI)